VVEFRDDGNAGLLALAPWQVLATTQSAFDDEVKLTLGEATEAGSTIIKTFRVIKMQVVCDYKDQVKWARRELIVPEYSQ
jgi:hypothetical protein